MSGMNQESRLRGRPRCSRCGGFVNGWGAQNEPQCSCSDRYRNGSDEDMSGPPEGSVFVWLENQD